MSLLKREWSDGRPGYTSWPSYYKTYTKIKPKRQVQSIAHQSIPLGLYTALISRILALISNYKCMV
jgi:hypothetical protein